MKLFLAFATLALLCAFQDPPAKPDPDAELKALRAEYKAAQQEYYRPFQEAKSDEERRKIKLDPAKSPDLTYMLKFKELAERVHGTEAGAGALLEVVSLAPRVKRLADAKRAVEILEESYIESPVMEKFAANLRYAGYYLGEETCRTALETIRQKSPHPKAKAAATFILAIQTMKTDEEKSRNLFGLLKKEFGDTSYAAKADAFLFELDNLQIGKVAPDFEATDESGKKYRLSDYRGKVVVLDFWGFW